MFCTLWNTPFNGNLPRTPLHPSQSVPHPIFLYAEKLTSRLSIVEQENSRTLKEDSTDTPPEMKMDRDRFTTHPRRFVEISIRTRQIVINGISSWLRTPSKSKCSASDLPTNIMTRRSISRATLGSTLLQMVVCSIQVKAFHIHLSTQRNRHHGSRSWGSKILEP